MLLNSTAELLIPPVLRTFLGLCIEIGMDRLMSRKRIVVLTVEPGETALSTRKLVIESAGFNALSAVTCKQAIEIAAVHPVQAAMIDVDADDLPLSETIRLLLRHRPELRIYLLSKDGWIEDDLRPHISRVFQKFSDPSEIVEELSRAFSEARGTAS